MFNVENTINKWLKENHDDILKNISETIVYWLEENKQDIYKIIEKTSVNDRRKADRRQKK